MSNVRDGSKKLATYKYQALKAAKDLRYSKEVIRNVEMAKTEGEIARIMRFARKHRFND